MGKWWISWEKQKNGNDLLCWMEVLRMTWMKWDATLSGRKLWEWMDWKENSLRVKERPKITKCNFTTIYLLFFNLLSLVCGNFPFLVVSLSFPVIPSLVPFVISDFHLLHSNRFLLLSHLFPPILSYFHFVSSWFRWVPLIPTHSRGSQLYCLFTQWIISIAYRILDKEFLMALLFKLMPISTGNRFLASLSPDFFDLLHLQCN